MEIEFDDIKRGKTLSEREVDFARAGEVFAGVTATVEDRRQDYGEQPGSSRSASWMDAQLSWSGHHEAMHAALSV